MKLNLFKKKNSEAAAIENSTPQEQSLPRFFLFRLLERKPVQTICILALILNLLIEIFSRHSIIDAVVHMVTSPVVFLYNASIIALTLSISQLFKRKTFVITLFAVLWLALGITNFFLLSMRTTPLAASDFLVIRSVYLIVAVYLTPVQLVVIIAAIILALAFIVFVFVKLPKQKVKLKRSLIFILSTGLLVAVSTIGLLKVNALTDRFDELVNAYDNYGFVYCFSAGIVDAGISKPNDYSFENVYEVIARNDNDEDVSETDFKPNIIFFQMESFVDAEYFTEYKYSENPNPYFQELKETYSSGFLRVPSVGAGTANVEFEVLSGIPIYNFGAGEYPYKTILQKSTCESYPYILKELGYNTQAIHNHTATFYDRNLVYSRLGFDRFIPVEYMYDVAMTPLEWAKDYVLETEVMKALNDTEGRDFIYMISVQTHGKYPTEPIEETTIEVEGLPTEEETVGFEYYIQQVKENDQLLRKIVDNIKNFDEPTVLVIFGDHLPNFPIDTETYYTKDLYLSEYVVLSNFASLGLEDFEVINKDITTHQLIADTLDRLDIHNGIINKIHQNRENNENYYTDLEMIGYDILYGEKYSYGSEERYLPTDIQIGYGEILVNGAEVDKEKNIAYIKGEGFNKFSNVFINKELVETTYIDYNTLSISAEDLVLGGSITIGQIGADEKLIDRTENSYQWKG